MSTKDLEDSSRGAFEEAKAEAEELGGKTAFVSGEWLLRLVRKSFSNFWERATPEYFSEKYGTTEENFLVKKIIKVASRNATLLGGAAGAAISADAIVGLAGLPLTGGVSVGAALAIAGSILMSEVLLLTRLQLRMVAQIGRAMHVPLDPDDPEDILTILAFAIGGGVAETAGAFGMKVGGHVTKGFVKKHAAKDTLKAIQKVGAKIGVKILQRTILKYAVPAASILIGGGWNFFATKAVAKTAQKHFASRRAEMKNGRIL